MPNEKAVTKRIIRAVEKYDPDIWIMKVHGGGYQRAGIPDLLFCVNGMFLAVEVKHRKPGESPQALANRVSPRQKIEIEAITRAGGTAIVAWKPEQVLEALNEI